MKGEVNFPGQPYRKEDLDNLLGSLETGSRERVHDVFRHGAIADSQMAGETGPFFVTVAGDLKHVNVGSGLGYGPCDDSDVDADWPIAGLTMEPPLLGGRTVTAGERVVISADDLATEYSRTSGATDTGAYKRSPDGLGGYIDTPQSSGTQNIPLPTLNDGVFYVWLAYINTVDDTIYTNHKYTAKRVYFKKKDGYDIVVTEGLSRPDDDPRFFVIGSFTVSGGNIVALPGMTVDQTMMPCFKSRTKKVGIVVDSSKIPTVYVNGTDTFLDDHVNALGGGTVSPDNPHAVSFINVDGQIGATQISSGVIGYGLTGASGAAMSVKPDTTSAGATHAKVVYCDSYGIGVCVDDISLHEGATGVLEVKADGIGTTMIQDGAITNSKLAVDAVGATNYQDASIGIEKLDLTGFTGARWAGIPVGTITMYGGTVAPDGWLFCDGTLYNSDPSGIYGDLAARLSGAYGIGSGQFRVPDLRTRFPLGASVPEAVGPTGGVATVTLTVPQLPAHAHRGSPYTLNEGQPGSTYHLWSNSPGGGGANYTDNAQNLALTEWAADQPHTNMPPYLVLNFIIKY